MAALTVTVTAALGRQAVNVTATPWTLRAVHLPAREQLVSAHPITVAILDTGMSEQPILDGVQRAGYSFVTGPRSGTPPSAFAAGVGVGYHGTAVAGVVHSVNPHATLLHVRVINRLNSLSLRSAVDALRWAAGLAVPGTPPNRFPARVINASFTLNSVPGTGCAPAMQRAVNEVLARGSVIVASAGNRNAPAALHTPAGCRGVIAVAATDGHNRRAPYSNWGEAVALAAPGGTADEQVDVLRPGGGKAERMGTSFAAPLVSGAASLLLAEHPHLSPAAVAMMLERTAQPFPTGQCDQQPARSCGAGILNVAAAMEAARTWPGPVAIQSNQ